MTEVRVLDYQGQLISTTTRCGHVRKLLKSKQAKVVNKNPFTVQLLYPINTDGKTNNRKDNDFMDTISIYSPIDGESHNKNKSLLSKDLTHCIIAGDKNTCKLDIVKKMVNDLSNEDTNTLTFILDPNNRWKANKESINVSNDDKLNLLFPYVEMSMDHHAEIFSNIFSSIYHLYNADRDALYGAIMEAYEFDAQNCFNEINMTTIYDIITRFHPNSAQKYPDLANILSVFKDENSFEQSEIFSHQGIDLGHFILNKAGDMICNDPEDEIHHGVMIFNSGELSGNTSHMYFSMLAAYLSELIEIWKKNANKFKVFIVLDEAEQYLPKLNLSDCSDTILYQIGAVPTFLKGAADNTHFITITNNIDKLPSYVTANSNQIFFTHTDPSKIDEGTVINKILKCPDDVEALTELSDKEYMTINPHEFYGTIKRI